MYFILILIVIYLNFLGAKEHQDNEIEEEVREDDGGSDALYLITWKGEGINHGNKLHRVCWCLP